jgi:hypothetical protein
MKKRPMLDEGHWIRKKGGGWLISVPPEVRERLRVTSRMRLYWIITRRGEVFLSAKPERIGGRPPVQRLMRDLAAVQRELAHVHIRDATRDRGMYAEGFAHGYTQCYERMMQPDGPSAERGRRRALYRWAFPGAAYLTDPKQVGPRPAPSRPRVNARTRRAKRDAETWRRGVEAHSLDHYPAPDPSDPPASIEQGADTSGAQLPGVPLER